MKGEERVNMLEHQGLRIISITVAIVVVVNRVILDAIYVVKLVIWLSIVGIARMVKTVHMGVVEE